MSSAPRTSAVAAVVDGWRVVDALPTAYLVMSPDLRILHANPAYLTMLGRELPDIAGRPVFEAFPPSPEALAPDGTNPVETSFRRALATGRADAMPLQQYAVLDADSGKAVDRFWSIVSAPVFDADGGFKDVHLGARWNWAWSPSWMLTSGVQATRLLGSARMSPLVARPHNLTVSTAIAYRF